MARLKQECAAEREAAGLPPNDHQVVIVELDKRTTLKACYQEILQKLGDEFWDAKVSAKVLETRISTWVLRLEVELLIVDEVQHLASRSNHANEVTDRFKVFLDRGVVPIVFVGDEDSEAFFKANQKLAARLGAPLRLDPLRPEAAVRDRKLFKTFCAGMDDAMIECGIMGERAGLDGVMMLEGLLDTSGGHIGRVARLIETALPHAIMRGASRIEAWDLYEAVRTFAIEVGWCHLNPFLTRRGG